MELMKLSADDLDALRYAKSLLENPGLVAKITNVIGRPIEKGFDLLPQKWSQVIAGATRKSLEVALQVALTTMGDTPKAPSWERLRGRCRMRRSTWPERAQQKKGLLPS